MWGIELCFWCGGWQSDCNKRLVRMWYHPPVTMNVHVFPLYVYLYEDEQLKPLKLKFETTCACDVEQKSSTFINVSYFQSFNLASIFCVKIDFSGICLVYCPFIFLSFVIGNLKFIGFTNCNFNSFSCVIIHRRFSMPIHHWVWLRVPRVFFPEE